MRKVTERKVTERQVPEDKGGAKYEKLREKAFLPDELISRLSFDIKHSLSLRP